MGDGENEWENNTLSIFRQEKFMKSPVDAKTSYKLTCVSLCFLQVQTWPTASML